MFSQLNRHGKSADGGNYATSADGGNYATSAKTLEHPLTVEYDQISVKKHVSSSRLNSASPPFYPSASSNKEISLTQKRDGPAAPLHRNLQSSVTDERFSMSASNTMREKNLSDVGMNKLSIDNSGPGKSWGSSQYPRSRVQGRVQTPMENMAYQSTPQNQVNRVSNSSQHRNGQQAPTQTRQGPFQASGHQLRQRIQAPLSPDSALTTNSIEFRETSSPRESSTLNTALIGKVKNVEGNGRGSFSGGQGSSHGDVNFSGMPTFLPGSTAVEIKLWIIS